MIKIIDLIFAEKATLNSFFSSIYFLYSFFFYFIPKEIFFKITNSKQIKCYRSGKLLSQKNMGRNYIWIILELYLRAEYVASQLEACPLRKLVMCPHVTCTLSGSSNNAHVFRADFHPLLIPDGECGPLNIPKSRKPEKHQKVGQC